VSLDKEGAALADAVTAHAEKMADAGLKDYAIWLFRTAEVMRQASAGVTEALQRPPRLTVKQRETTLKGVEHSTETRKALSERFTKGKSPNMDAARKAGYPSLRALAKALGCSASFLSQVAADDRPMPADKAAAFKKLTGKDWQ
jgi:hypothetical protein